MSDRPAWVCEITLAEYHMGWNRVNALAGDVATRRPPKDAERFAEAHRLYEEWKNAEVQP